MKIKFPILLFIFGLFLFLLPSVTEAACSSLNYPVNKWQRVWYVSDDNGNFGSCYGDGPDEYGCGDEMATIGIDQIDFDNNWGLTGKPGGYDYGHVGFTSSRTIFINPAGTYRFYLGSDDGSRLYIDGAQKINLWTPGSWKEATVDVSLSKGEHQFRIDYFEVSSSNGIKFTQTRLTSGAHCEWYGPGWGGGIGHFYCGTDAGTGICGYFNSSSGTGGYSVCLIGQQCELASTSGDSCGTTDTVCQREKCPSYSSKNGESCRVDRNDCTSFAVTLYSVTSYGVWDAADFKCVQCNYTTKKESAVCGSSTGIYQTCDFAQRRSAACTGTSDTQCESACGASSDCDEKAVGDSCGTGKTCDSSCQCVTVCTRAAPSVTATNSPQTGNPGDTKTFTFNITSNDTTVCSSSTFNLTKSFPSCWTCTLNKTSVTISPGSTDSTVTLSVTSPSTATAGNYTVSVIATNSGATSYSGTGSATYTVVVACTRANPGVSISPSSQSGTPGQTLSYTATIINYDSSGCGSSTFNLTKSCPSGWTCNLSSSSITISPNGSSGAVSLSVTSSATATDGNYTVSVTATNSGATSYSGTGNATYIVTVSGAGINPPIVTTKQATSVTQTSATLNGTLDSLGYDSAACPSCSCIVWFEWGTTGTAGVSGSYGNKTTPVEMAAFGSITPVTISGLTSGQTYYFEAFAKNGGSW